MARPAGDGCGRPPDPERFLQPLDLICAEHGRRRDLSKLLHAMALQVAIDPVRASRLLEELRHDLSSHVLDEEQDLYLLLRRRCKPEDGIESVLTRLAAERATVVGLCNDILTELDAPAQAGERQVPRSLREKLLALSRALRRHFALLNSILIPIARARLRTRDLQSLARRVAARRGVVLPSGKDR